MQKAQKPPTEMRLRVLAAVDYAPGDSIRERIKNVSARTFADAHNQIQYQFTWRTISTWLYRFKRHGITTLDAKVRSDRGTMRKVKLSPLNQNAQTVRSLSQSQAEMRSLDSPEPTLTR